MLNPPCGHDESALCFASTSGGACVQGRDSSIDSDTIYHTKIIHLFEYEILPLNIQKQLEKYT